MARPINHAITTGSGRAGGAAAGSLLSISASESLKGARTIVSHRSSNS